MSNSSNDTRLEHLVASSLRDSPSDGDSLVFAERLICEGKGRALFEALVHESRGDLQDVVANVMGQLEQMMDASPRVASYLMARLYPLAGRARDHETYRRIELWMHDISVIGVAQVLRSLAREGVRPALKSRYEEWARLMEERSTQQGE
jgi:hypothetical protein